MGTFRGHGIEIRLKTPEDFLKVKETLERIGVTSRKEKKLFQTAHIFSKRGEYAIVHFKEMFDFDGRKSNMTEEDIARRNTIVKLLNDWGLVEIIDLVSFETFPKLSVSQLKIIPFREKKDWNLSPKYQIGKKKYD